MTQDEIIEMAAEIWNSGSEFPIPSSDDIILFASKVVEAEREACAKECEHTALRMGSEWMAQHCAQAIRARGQA
jgi:hypothetical protein